MDFEQARRNMVEQQIRPWNVLDFDVLDALEEIPRERFVQAAQQGYAYADMELPLPNGGKMLEPKMVARLVQALALRRSDRVLEVGTGSGYASALLAKLSGSLITCDTDERRLAAARAVLEQLDITNIEYRCTDGLQIQADESALFDAVYIGGSLNAVPEQLKAQLADGGRMVVVAGSRPAQQCLLITRNGDTFTQTVLFETVIAPLQQQGSADWLKATGKFKF